MSLNDVYKKSHFFNLMPNGLKMSLNDVYMHEFDSVDKKVSEMKLGPQNVNKDFE